MLDSLLNPVFAPLLKLPPAAGLAIISFIVSLLITIVYKLVTDQTQMKDLKQRQKDFQKKLKENKKDPEKMMKIQKDAMQVNMQYMKQSFKPTLITFLPIIIIFGWLNMNMAFEPILPGQEFTATLVFDDMSSGDVSISVPGGIDILGDSIKEISNDVVFFTLKGEPGDYLLVFTHEGRSYDKELTITNDRRYAPVNKIFKNAPLKQISLSNEKLIAINLFNTREGGFFQGRVGWLGTYIIFSLIFSLGLRKLMKIY